MTAYTISRETYNEWKNKPDGTDNYVKTLNKRKVYCAFGKVFGMCFGEDGVLGKQADEFMDKFIKFDVGNSYSRVVDANDIKNDFDQALNILLDTAQKAGLIELERELVGV